MNLVDLKVERRVLVGRMRALANGNDSRPEEDIDFKIYSSRIAEIDRQMAPFIEANDRRIDHNMRVMDAEAQSRTQPYEGAVKRWLRGRTTLADQMQIEARAFAAGTTNLGGATVAFEFSNILEVALKSSSSMASVATSLHTATGAALPYPTLNFTTVSGAQKSESAASTVDSSTPFGSFTLNAYSYRSNMVQVSAELLDDSAFDEETLLIRPLFDSAARALNPLLTTGSGASQPQGVVGAATIGKTGLVGQTTGVIYDDLVDLVHSLDPAYFSPECVFMAHPSTIKFLRKIKDTAGSPLLTGADEKGQPRILGFSLVANPDWPVMAANARSIGFGRFDKYVVRLAPSVVIKTVEKYADQNQVGFMAILRADGNLINAGTNPVVVYANSAT